MNRFQKILSGGDRRSTGAADKVALSIRNEEDFSQLFSCLFNSDRLVVMRAADAIEKYTESNIAYLQVHKKEILEFLAASQNIEFRWHLAQLVTRLELTTAETDFVWNMLEKWAADASQSRIVRVNALQGLYDLGINDPARFRKLKKLINIILLENLPSLNARIRKLKLDRP